MKCLVFSIKPITSYTSMQNYQITDIKEIMLIHNYESPDYRQNSSENVMLIKSTANEYLIIDEKP